MPAKNGTETSEFFSKDNIFAYKTLSWFRPNSHVTHVVVRSNIIFAVTTANKLIIAGILDRSYFAEVNIESSTNDLVHNIFVDSRGYHILISMQSGANLYTTRKSKKFKQIQKARDHLIDSVAWNSFNESDNNTQEILIGTNEGYIFEAMLSISDEIFSSSGGTVIWKELIKLDHSITGLAVIRYPPGSALVPVGEPQLCAVLASTPGRLYQFFGLVQSSNIASSYRYMNAQSAATALREGYIPGFFAPVFESYSQNASGAKCIEFPMTFGYSDLKVFKSVDDEVPSHFAWMNASGIYIGQLDASRLIDADIVASAGDSSTPLRISLAKKANLIPYPKVPGEAIGLPLCVALTAFHVIVAYADRIKAINLLDGQPIFVQSVREGLGGKLSGICNDPVSNNVWLFSTSSICQLTVANEGLRVWRILLDKQEFNEARKHCKTQQQLNEVNIREADLCFTRGEYRRAAELFAETTVPFEEVALRFSQISPLTELKVTDKVSGPVMTGIALTEDFELLDEESKPQEANDNDQTQKARVASFGSQFQLLAPCVPLKIFLRAKLRRLGSEMENCQATVIVLWFIEILLGEIGLLENKCVESNASVSKLKEIDDVRNELRSIFNSKASKILHNCKDAVYGLLYSHGNSEDFVYFSKLNGDYDKLVDHYMTRGDYAEALFIFTNHPSTAAKLYNYSTQLVTHDPKALVDAWIRAGQRLSPCKLLPAILLLPSLEAIRYLEFALDKLHCREQAIHHQLILLYANLGDSTADARLLGYLNLYTPSDLHEGYADINGADNVTEALTSANTGLESSLTYDPGFAIRTAKEKNCLKSTVFLLQSLGLYTQAVEEALSKNDVSLAKEIVNLGMLSSDTQRTLWLRIARHVITDRSSLREATALLKESSLLRLEDVFPFFPDFITIDEFREVICDSLDTYNSQIEQLKAEMMATVESTNEIRAQLTNLKSHYEIIPENARCSQCLQALALRTFYVFPCGHFFHTDCLLNLVRPFLSDPEASKLAELYKKSVTDPTTVRQFRSYFDDLVAADCAFCGKMAIDGVSRLFFPDENAYEEERKKWLLS